MLADGSLIADAHGRLSLPSRQAQTAVETAIRMAAESEAQMTRRGIGVPLQSADGESAVLHVLPLTGGNLRPGLAQRAVAAVFVATAERGAHVPQAAISMLYDLTPAESQIFVSLAKGLTLDQTAAAHGVARSTVKTHLLRIFDKTGCRRQAELVALADRLSLSV
jgi:DNA-binding CsgD family transcriptional regulator